MCLKIINSKLYNQYYPIRTEEQKTAFLIENHTVLLKLIREALFRNRSEYLARTNKYVNQLKKETTFLGTVKKVNVLHNEHVISKMQHDHIFDSLRNKEAIMEKIQYSLIMNEAVSIEDINELLLCINHDHRRTLLNCAFGLCIVIGTLLVFFLH